MRTVTKTLMSAHPTHELMVVPVRTDAPRTSAIARGHVLATTARMLSRSVPRRQFLRWVRTVAIPPSLNARWLQVNQRAHALGDTRRTMVGSPAPKSTSVRMHLAEIKQFASMCSTPSNARVSQATHRSLVALTSTNVHIPLQQRAVHRRCGFIQLRMRFRFPWGQLRSRRQRMSVCSMPERRPVP